LESAASAPRGWIALIDAGDGIEPLFLQAKEVQPFVLAHYCGEASTETRASAPSLDSI